MSAHTPGPWICFDMGSERQSVMTVGRSPETVAVINDSDADARLIAAAPDLLAALEAAVAIHDSFAFRRRANTGSKHDPDPNYIALARAAIVKVRGGA